MATNHQTNPDTSGIAVDVDGLYGDLRKAVLSAVEDAFYAANGVNRPAPPAPQADPQHRALIEQVLGDDMRAIIRDVVSASVQEAETAPASVPPPNPAVLADAIIDTFIDVPIDAPEPEAVLDAAPVEIIVPPDEDKPSPVAIAPVQKADKELPPAPQPVTLAAAALEVTAEKDEAQPAAAPALPDVSLPADREEEHPPTNGAAHPALAAAKTEIAQQPATIAPAVRQALQDAQQIGFNPAKLFKVLKHDFKRKGEDNEQYDWAASQFILEQDGQQLAPISSTAFAIVLAPYRTYSQTAALFGGQIKRNSISSILHRTGFSKNGGGNGKASPATRKRKIAGTRTPRQSNVNGNGSKPDKPIFDEAPKNEHAGRNVSSLSQYLREMGQIKLFTAQEERDVFQVVEASRRHLISALIDIPSGMDVIKEFYTELDHRVFENINQAKTKKTDSDKDAEVSEDGTADEPAEKQAPNFMERWEAIGDALDNLLEAQQDARAGAGLAQSNYYQSLKTDVLDMVLQLRPKDEELLFIVDEILRNKSGITDDIKPAVSEAARARQCLGAAKEKALVANLRLSVYFARRKQNRGLDLEDLVQEANMGLARAVDKFDYTRGYRFGRMASWWIKQAIDRGIMDKGMVIRTPVHMQAKISKQRWAAIGYERQHGHTPTPKQLAGYMTERATVAFAKEKGRAPTATEQAGLEMTEEEVVKTSKMFHSVVSLDMPVGGHGSKMEDGDSTLGDLLKDEGAVDPLEATARRQEAELVAGLIDTLPERYANVLRMRFGIGRDSEMTLEEVGDELGVTRERIRQIEMKALGMLRKRTPKALKPDADNRPKRPANDDRAPVSRAANSDLEDGPF